MSPELRNLPNVLSLSRIPMSLAFVSLYTNTDKALFWACLAIVAAALLTDVLDGHVARKLNVTSETGYFLDGLGDKAFTVAIILVISRQDPDHIAIYWVLITREIVLYALRALDKRRRENIKKLRLLSLLQAFFIRVFFLGFFIEEVLLLNKIYAHDLFSHYSIFAYLSGIVGCLSIIILSRYIISQELERVST